MTLRVFFIALLLCPPFAGCRRPDASAPTLAPSAPPYIERVTGGARPEEPLPLIIAVHGYGDRPEDFSALASGFSAKARWIFLRGFAPMGSGHAWFPIRFRDGRAEALAAGLLEASRKVAEEITKLRTLRPTKGPVIVTGFSQGGMISFALAVQRPPVVDAAFPVGGWLPDAMIPTEHQIGIPVVAMHGADDRIVPFEATAAMAERLETRIDRFEFVPFEGVGHTISAEMRAALFAAIEKALSL